MKSDWDGLLDDAKLSTQYRFLDSECPPEQKESWTVGDVFRVYDRPLWFTRDWRLVFPLDPQREILEVENIGKSRQVKIKTPVPIEDQMSQKLEEGNPEDIVKWVYDRHPPLLLANIHLNTPYGQTRKTFLESGKREISNSKDGHLRISTFGTNSERLHLRSF